MQFYDIWVYYSLVLMLENAGFRNHEKTAPRFAQTLAKKITL